ncbi:DUF2924 domain-containing protein [Novosphingobium sp. PS1R-30]|uniref:DUF2924 domain-containing protein n=1 Tax=Novosphingobium anseongense TaxID=3133436 RepID=A0ABU8S1P9_9SPHN
MAGSHLDAELAALAGMSIDELRCRWSELTGTPAPKIQSGLLHRAIAWEMQAQIHGGHSRGLRQHIAAADGRTPNQRDLAPGTRFVREWKGVLYMVTVGDDGKVHWNGKTWNSLSAVARAITGTRWSGPAFFGLPQESRAA